MRFRGVFGDFGTTFGSLVELLNRWKFVRFDIFRSPLSDVMWSHVSSGLAGRNVGHPERAKKKTKLGQKQGQEPHPKA